MSDTNTTVDRMGSLFNDFIAAAEAIKERPVLEAKVRDAEARRDWAQSEARFASERFDEQCRVNDELRAKVAQLEADLAQATFREKEARGSMELVLGALKDTMNNAKAAVELVEPTPAPEPTTEPEVTVIDTPFPYTTRDVEHFASTDYTSTSENPTYGGIGAGDAAPTLSAALTVDAPPVPPEAPAYNLPYSNRAYWLKPDAVSWRDWVGGGGDKAPWVRETDREWTETWPSNQQSQF